MRISHRVMMLIVLALIAALIVFAALVIYSGHQGARPVDETTTNSTLGLKLVASLNASVIRQGQFVNLTVAVYNTKSGNNTLPDSGLGSLEVKTFGGYVPSRSGSPCDATKAAAAMVSQGNLTLADLNSAHWNSNYSLAVGSFAHCQIPPQPYPAYWVFLPLNDSAFPGYYTVPAPMYFTILMNGYHYPTPRDESFVFQPGVYTVTVWDEWGQIVQLRFTVTS
jgi:hypothetical protein